MSLYIDPVEDYLFMTQTVKWCIDSVAVIYYVWHIMTDYNLDNEYAIINVYKWKIWSVHHSDHAVHVENTW